jgi:typhoid toxin secretion A
MTEFEKSWEKTGEAEAGFVNDPADAGGETNFGITIAVARAYGYTGAMIDLPKDVATAIAKKKYWDVLMLDQISELSPSIAAELFDTGFLAGQAVAALFFQKALNIFGRVDLPLADRPYPQVAEDGHLGPMTVHAFKLYLDNRKSQGEVVMLRCLNCQQGAHFIEICCARPLDDKFVFGWFLNRIAI